MHSGQQYFKFIFFVLISLVTQNLLAVGHFGSANASHISPFTSWATAAKCDRNGQVTDTDYGKSVIYCNISPIYDIPIGSGNYFNSNPLFLLIANHNFRLQLNSLCINSGNNSLWMTNAFDSDGNSRIINLIVNLR